MIFAIITTLCKMLKNKKELYRQGAFETHEIRKEKTRDLIVSVLKQYYRNEYYSCGKKQISISELSRRTGISREHLSRKYKDLMDVYLYVDRATGHTLNCI